MLTENFGTNQDKVHFSFITPTKPYVQSSHLEAPTILTENEGGYRIAGGEGEIRHLLRAAGA